MIYNSFLIFLIIYVSFQQYINKIKDIFFCQLITLFKF